MDKTFQKSQGTSPEKRSISDWHPYVTAYKSSGLSLKEFYKTNELKVCQFRYWVYRLRKLEESQSSDLKAQPQRLLPIKVQEVGETSSQSSTPETQSFRFHWQTGKLSLELVGLNEVRICELMRVVGDWYAKS